MPEREGWVKREALFNFSGRSRKPQFSLAEKFALKDFAQPAGGCCFLTNEHYTQKLKDLWQHRGKREYELDDIVLLKVGRHIRPNKNFKLIIGREEGENNFLSGYRHQFVHLKTVGYEGPLALIDGEASAEEIYLASSIVARYSDGKHAEQVNVNVSTLDGAMLTLNVKPLAENEIQKEWYV